MPPSPALRASRPHQDLIGQITLVGVQRQDALLNRARRHEAVHRHRLLLTQAVRPVRGLILDDRISPRVEVEHVVGCRQVEVRAASLERNEKQVGLTRLKRLHQLLALLARRRAVEVEVLDVGRLHVGAHQLQVLDELTELQCPITVRPQLGDRLRHPLQFGARQPTLGAHQPGVTSRLPQPRQLLQH